MRKLTDAQLRKIFAMQKRKKEILNEYNNKNKRDEPFTVTKTKSISQGDLIRMQRDAGVR